MPKCHVVYFSKEKKYFFTLAWRSILWIQKTTKILAGVFETNGLIKLTLACWCVRRHPLSYTVACCISRTITGEPLVTHVLDHNTGVILCHLRLNTSIHKLGWRVALLSFFWCICKEIKFAPVKLFHKSFTISKRWINFDSSSSRSLSISNCHIIMCLK